MWLRHARPARLTPRASPSVPLPGGVGGANGATGASPVRWRRWNRWRPPLRHSRAFPRHSRHSRAGGNLNAAGHEIPACAGMTETGEIPAFAGMTGERAGMTAEGRP